MNHRYNVVYLALIVIACTVGYLASNRSVEPEGRVRLPDLTHLSSPELELEGPDLSMFAMPVFKTRTMPRLQLSGRLESVIREVRSSLLASAVPTVSSKRETARAERHLAESKLTAEQANMERLASNE